MLQNAYFLAKIGADTAENEQHFAEILPTDALWPQLGMGGYGPAADAYRGAYDGSYEGSYDAARVTARKKLAKLAKPSFRRPCVPVFGVCFSRLSSLGKKKKTARARRIEKKGTGGGAICAPENMIIER